MNLELVGKGAVLRVARQGEATVARQVDRPEDVLPLGQALLATPLPVSSEGGERAGNAPASNQVEPKPPEAPPPPRREPTPTTTAEAVPTASIKPSPRLVVGGGADARYVGGSDVAWLGPTLNAGLMMGRWLPSISLRQQSSLSDGPSIDELSFAIAVQSRFEISPLELRAGLALRAASVQRQLGHHHGEQSRLEGRIGAVISGAIPVLRWANVVLALDADVVGVSRESTGPDATDEQSPMPFPTYTVGGSVCFEVPL